MTAQHHSIVVGLGFGDEGKGATVDYLADLHGYMDVVRYNGGAQAAHHVQHPDSGHVHCFAQVGAAAMRPGRRTYLSKFVVIEPLAMEREFATLDAAGFADCQARQVIDGRATIATPYHRALNRIREMSRGDARHGSCGQGIGIAHLDRALSRAPGLCVLDVMTRETLIHRLEQVRVSVLDRARQTLAEQAYPALPQQLKALAVLSSSQLSHTLAARYRAILLDSPVTIDPHGELLAETLRSRGVIFEGAQGVGLDPDAGFFPHVTATRTTPHNALALIAEAESTRARFMLGVCRAYATRHGAGPFPTEDADLGAAIPDWHNGHGPWQGSWRVGWFDEVWCRHAVRCCDDELDALAITCLDRLDGITTLRTATHYGARTSELTWPATSREAFAQQVLTSAPTYRTHRGWPQVFRPDAPAQLSDEAAHYINHISEITNLPVHHIATGSSARDRHLIGSWQ